jgi:hypothetical protein
MAMGRGMHLPWRRWLDRDREQHYTTGLRESVRLHMVLMVITTAVVLRIWLRAPQRPPSDGSLESTPPDDVGVRCPRRFAYDAVVARGRSVASHVEDRVVFVSLRPGARRWTAGSGVVAGAAVLSEAPRHLGKQARKYRGSRKTRVRWASGTCMHDV